MPQITETGALINKSSGSDKMGVTIMDTARCRAVLAAANEGTIKGAAEKLGYTPSAVSQLISAMEHDLGLRLFDRGHKGVRLTDSGKRLLPVVCGLLDREEQIYQTATDIKGLLTGSVTISAFSSISTYWLPSVIQSFQKQFPGVHVNLQEGSWQDIHQWLEDRQVDIGFCSYSKTSPHDWIPLAEDRMMAVLSKDHPMSKKEKFPIIQLSREPLILTQKGEYCNAVIMMKEREIPFSVHFITKEPYAAMAMAEQGMGISVLNELVTQTWKGRVAIIPVDPPYSITLGISVPSQQEASPAVTRFIQHAEKMLKQKGAKGQKETV